VEVRGVVAEEVERAVAEEVEGVVAEAVERAAAEEEEVEEVSLIPFFLRISRTRVELSVSETLAPQHSYR
jgi:hypothetical protein